MNRNKRVFFTPPRLTNEGAHELMDFLEELIVVLQTHYRKQTRSYTRKQTEESRWQIENGDFDDDVPF